MKFISFCTLLICLILTGLSGLSQTTKVYNYDNVTVKPKYSEKLFKEFISENLVFPDSAMAIYLNSHVYISFIIETNGTISDIVLEKGLGYGCNAEALRIVNLMTKWDPGQVDDQVVRTKFILPVAFDIYSINLTENRDHVFRVDGKLRSNDGQGLELGFVHVYLGDSLILEHKMNGKRDFRFDIYSNNYYKFLFGSAGCVTKEVVVNTFAPQSRTEYMSFNVTLFPSEE